MGQITEFHSPAYQAQKDFAGDQAGYQAFAAAWNQNLNHWTDQSIVGNPWSNTNDGNRCYYYNPLTADPELKLTTPITWTAFPNRLIYFYNGHPNPSAPYGTLSMDQVYELADTGQITVDSQTWYLNKPGSPNELQRPGGYCPQIDWSSTSDFSPLGPRGWQDEYSEWSVLRDASSGKITKVMLTCENPDYWFTMWHVSPQKVLELYQQYISPSVQLTDLYLLDSQGNPVVNPITGANVYNPTNKWNSGPVMTASQGGAMHLTSPPNTLGAEIYLAAAATIQRTLSDDCATYDSQCLICCSQYGQNFRNSDPNIGFNANKVAKEYLVTLTDPVGLYMQFPDFSQFVTPDGTDASEFYTVVRGTRGDGKQGNDSILHAIYEVPAGKGYVVGDIKISGQPINWAGQIVANYKMALRASASEPPQDACDNSPRPCVVQGVGTQPWVVQVLPESLCVAGDTDASATTIRQGQSVSDLAIVVQGGQHGASITFSNPGITITSQRFESSACPSPGQTDSGGTQAYIVDLTVAADAPTGDVDICVINPGTNAVCQSSGAPDGVPWAPGWMVIAAAAPTSPEAAPTISTPADTPASRTKGDTDAQAHRDGGGAGGLLGFLRRLLDRLLGRS